MRIVAGVHGGRRIDAPKGTGTRPTPERVREAVFSMLGSLDGLVVLDLFAGSGAMGLEALSRGAERATLVDRDRSACASIERNVDVLGVRERCRVLRADWRRALESASDDQNAYDIVFLDPPYGAWATLQEDLGQALGPLVAPSGRVVAEHPASEVLSLSHMQVERRRTYGDTAVSFLVPTASSLES
jgi:16S rRNA (guanine966-N2)-methyltransferase